MSDLVNRPSAVNPALTLGDPNLFRMTAQLLVEMARMMGVLENDDEVNGHAGFLSPCRFL